jgi:hypothetical protein
VRDLYCTLLCEIWYPAGPGGRAGKAWVYGPRAWWDCGFESRRGHGCLSLVSIVCCWVEVSATGWSLVQRSPTDCGVVCVWVWSWSPDNETLAHWGLLRHWKGGCYPTIHFIVHVFTLHSVFTLKLVPTQSRNFALIS